MNPFYKFIFSMPFMTILLLLFAFFCGIATFIENDFGTETAWAAVYNARWFEIIQILLGVNLTYNIIRFKLYKKEKLPAFLFHVGLLFILLGSGLTRYLGYEGTLHIRESQVNDMVRSTESYIQVSAYKDDMVYGAEYKKLISKLGFNGFDFSFNIKDDEAEVEFKEYIPNAVRTIVDDENGVPTIALTLSKDNEKTSIVLKEGDAVKISDVVYSFNNSEETENSSVVNFTLKDNKFYFTSNKKLHWFAMADGSQGEYESNSVQEFGDKNLYTIDEINFAARYIGLKGKDKLVSEKITPQTINVPLDAVVINLTYKGQTREVALFGRGKGYKGEPVKLMIDDTLFVAEWGSTILKLPFAIRLNDFQLERYPGSNSPSSYASEVVVVDNEKNITKPYRIYMNHVLDYRGYRFFQASYDQDELGTVLSVNKDPGKLPTYLGYFLLSFGLLVNVLNPNSRFRKLSSLIQKDTIKNTAASLIVSFFIGILLLNPSMVNAQEVNENTLKLLESYDKKHADHFGKILIQSTDGRIKPIDTLSREILNKVYRSENYKNVNSNQFLLAMISSIHQTQMLPLVRVTHPELKKLIGIDESVKYASYDDFFNPENGQYKLIKYVEASNRKKDAEKNQFDKDILKVDERLNILFYTYTLEAFRIIPKIGDENNRWYSIGGALQNFDQQEASNVKAMFASYFEALEEGLKSGNWENADKIVDRIQSYQIQYASNIIPSQTKINAELFFSKARIFDRLTPVYLLCGFVLLIFVFAKMIAPKTNIKPAVKVLFYICLVAFIIHTFGLGLRWFIAEHAPWSNGYESMIYIAWAIGLAGLFFARTSVISMSLTYVLAGITLFVAHLSWMDAQITNLVPVLKSYWLTIHVSVITASYGFLGLCSLLGFFVLILYILKTFKKSKNYKDNIERNITEATRINEMSMILGLSLLTIGNFLGGVWANESWGRYWGWDPKETWSLISILLYSIIVHIRFVPKLNNQFIFAIFSTVAYASIIMTYFGVNFYLSGMHSYAAGDPVPVPAFVYWITAVVSMIIICAICCVYEEKKVGRTLKKL